MGEVYPPSEDTLLLASAARKTRRAAEVGCGSGAATLALAREAEYLVAIDITLNAARETASRLAQSSLACRVDVIAADTLTPFRDAAFDTVYSNPPYLPCSYEEEPLWCGGERGVEYSIRLAEDAASRLAEQGCLVLVASTLSDYALLLKELRRLYHTTRVLAEKPVGLYEKLLLIEACRPKRYSAEE